MLLTLCTKVNAVIAGQLAHALFGHMQLLGDPLRRLALGCARHDLRGLFGFQIVGRLYYWFGLWCISLTRLGLKQVRIDWCPLWVDYEGRWRIAHLVTDLLYLSAACQKCLGGLLNAPRLSLQVCWTCRKRVNAWGVVALHLSPHCPETGCVVFAKGLDIAGNAAEVLAVGSTRCDARHLVSKRPEGAVAGSAVSRITWRTRAREALN